MSVPIKLMDRFEARTCASRIGQLLTAAGNNVAEAAAEMARLKKGEGWRHLEDQQGQPYTSWDDCLDRHFQMSRRTFFRRLEAARIRAECQIDTCGELSDSAVRELAGVPAGQRADLVSQAEEEGGATAARILELKQAAWEALSPEARLREQEKDNKKLAQESTRRHVREGLRRFQARYDAGTKKLLRVIREIAKIADLDPEAQSKRLNKARARVAREVEAAEALLIVCQEEVRAARRRK